MGISLSNNYVLGSMTAAFAAGAYKSFEQFHAVWNSLNCSTTEYLILSAKMKMHTKMGLPLDGIEDAFKIEEDLVTKCHEITNPYLIATAVCGFIALASLSYLTYKSFCCCRR